MGVRLKTFLLLTVAVVVSMVSYVCWYSNAEKQRMEQELLAQAENYSYAFHAQLNSVRERMLQLALFAANDGHIRELMAAAATAVEEEGGGAGGVRAAAIRRELYAHLHSGIRQLALKFDIVTLHFHLTPGALSFLRFHSPEDMGDRLDDVRPMIVATGREEQPFSGFEIGRYFAGVRAAAPIFAPGNAEGEKKCVGVVEFGTPIDTLLDGLHTNRPWLNAAAFVFDAPMRRKMVPATYTASTRELFIATPTGKHLQLSATTSKEMEAFLRLQDFKDGLFGAQNFSFSRAGAVYNAAVLQLDDFKAQQNWKNPPVGRVVVWQDISSRMKQYKATVASLVWYGILLFLVLEACIYLGLYLVSSKLKEELEHQRRLERVSGRALEAVSNLTQLEQQPHVQLNRILQDQLSDAVEQLDAELGMFISARQPNGEFRILAASDMVWSTVQSANRYVNARNQLIQQGYISIKMENNVLARAMDGDTDQVLENPEKDAPDILSALPEGHPPIRNMLMVPIVVGKTTMGLLVLANRPHGYGTRERIIARAYASAAALLLHSDLREVERLSALETARVKEELFRNLNHELRTPLNTINAMSKKLGETTLDSIQAHGMKQITEASQRLTHLMEEVLLLAGFNTEEKNSIQAIPFRPAALLSNIVTDFAEKARQRGIELYCRCDEELPTRFNGDSEKIAMILRQLVGNAIKFSRDAEVILSVKSTGKAEGSGPGKCALHHLRFAVTDHGIGIAKEQHELIFEPFYQCDSSRAREYEGAGLGLTVASKVAALLGSKVCLESEVGVGSTFYFDLDLPSCPSKQEADTCSADECVGAQNETAEQQYACGDEEQLLELLQALEEPLSHSRPRQCKVITALMEKKRWPGKFAAQVDKLLSLMEKYRYPEALKVVHLLRSRLDRERAADRFPDNPTD